MPRHGRVREGKRPQRGTLPESKLPVSRSKRKKDRPVVLYSALVTMVIIIMFSVVAFFSIISQPTSSIPSPGLVDAVGTKARSSDGTLSTVRITIRNNGTGSLDISKLALSWQGPGKQATLYMDKNTWASPSKENFAVGGTGSTADGWEPLAGKFLVKTGTVAYLVVNLTAQGGINDPLGPGQSFKVVVTLEGGGSGSGNFDSRTYRVPTSLGPGVNVVLTEVK